VDLALGNLQVGVVDVYRVVIRASPVILSENPPPFHGGREANRTIERGGHGGTLNAVGELR
jgi:hypothetical protein